MNQADIRGVEHYYYGSGRVTHIPSFIVPIDRHALGPVNRAARQSLAAERIRPPRTRWTLDRIAIPGRSTR